MAVDNKTTSVSTILKHDDVIKWRHFPCYWPFVREIHRWPVNCPHKGQWRGALMFSLICAWIYGWVNNREAGDLRRHCAHYDGIVMNSSGTEAQIFQEPLQYNGCGCPVALAGHQHPSYIKYVKREFSGLLREQPPTTVSVSMNNGKWKKILMFLHIDSACEVFLLLWSRFVLQRIWNKTQHVGQFHIMYILINSK